MGYLITSRERMMSPIIRATETHNVRPGETRRPEATLSGHVAQSSLVIAACLLILKFSLLILNSDVRNNVLTWRGLSGDPVHDAVHAVPGIVITESN